MAKPLSRANRVVARALAIAWIVAGAAAIVLGIARHRWLGVPLGLLAVWYGLLWVRVARTGRWIAWPWRLR